jgi:nitrogen fixation/metabolism regulation signal transduction histidine kinase
MEQRTAKNAVRTDEDFRRMVEEIADQLCLTIGGNFDHLVRVEAHDETVEKLEMVVNFVLATASRSIEEVKQAKAQLEQQLDIRRKLER